MPRIAFDPAYNRQPIVFRHRVREVETEGGPLTWDPDFRPRERVLVYADRGGCGEYRIIGPSRALLRAGLVPHL